jgi:serine protease Do
MSLGLILRGATAVALALSAASALSAPVGKAGSAVPNRAPMLAQSQPEAPSEPAVPPAAEAPPPILPAPHMPGGEPVVKLPPPGEPSPTAPAIAGLPVAPNGTVFSFADLAESLLGSVVYISTSQRIAVSGRAPVTPDAPSAPQDSTPPNSDEATPPPSSPPGEDFFDDFFDKNGKNGEDPRTVQSLGSGFVIDPSGLIVTNNHVIADADEITANFADGRKFDAKIVGIDDKTDLALLKIDAPAPLQAAKFGRSDKMRVGDWVLAIGNPFGFSATVTAGIVSALDRDINSGPYDHYIQTDASINRGNSGGPLFNIGGEVVGINTAIMSPTGGSIGIGFAVPSEIAVPVIEQLRRFGQVHRGWIGVRIQDVTDEVASGLGMVEAKGAFIAGLTDDGPAAKAGIKEGDVVVEFNGKPVKSMRELPRLVADTAPGDTVDVTVMRDRQSVTLKIEVGLLQDEKVAAASAEGSGGDNSPATPPADNAAQMFGLSLGKITDEARKTFSLDSSVEGVLVTSVEPGSEADNKSVKPGEVIVQVSQTDVTDPSQVIDKIEKLKAEGRRTVMLLVSGADKKLRFVSLKIDQTK